VGFEGAAKDRFTAAEPAIESGTFGARVQLKNLMIGTPRIAGGEVSRRERSGT